MKRILLDVNVILDVLLDRRPHADASSFVWASVERGDAKGLLAAHGVTTIHYLVRNVRGTAAARRTVDIILRVLDVARVDGEVIGKALSFGWSDFEDAVTAAAAEAAHCDIIVSRDYRGFPDSPVREVTPEAAAPLLVR